MWDRDVIAATIGWTHFIQSRPKLAINWSIDITDRLLRNCAIPENNISVVVRSPGRTCVFITDKTCKSAW